ncbi:uncharacterized protein ARMOST_13632 [Armillaria ostoyae]|uniref:Uncharacterized protein n=1 Tax=Armillaria ostoyae TaxID=47428 RepID=A0A284RND3_ARMOS|nr:uncharacterized protein ARMOST_13632 [Armillaria ostoyae]
MASSLDRDELSDPNLQPHSPSTTLSPTPTPSQQWGSHSWRRTLSYSNDTPSPPTPWTSFLRGPLLPNEMPLPVQAERGTPLRPLPHPPQRRTTGTYGLAMTASPPLPTTQITYHPRSGPSYPSRPGLSWASPLREPNAYSYDPPSEMLPFLMMTVPRMMRPGTIPLPMPTNFLPPPSSSPLTVILTSRTSTTSPPQTQTPTSLNLFQGQNEPRPHNHNHSHSPTGWRPTHSTSTAPTLSGTNSLPSTSSYSAPIEPLPGKSEGTTSRPDMTSALTTIPPWTGTLPSSEETPLTGWGGMPPSRPAYFTTETAMTMAPLQAMYYEEDQELEHPESRSSWSSPSLNWQLDSRTRTALNTNQFDTFHYDQETFRRYISEPSRDREGHTSAPTYPFPLPDQPPRQVRQHGQYYGQKTSRLYAGTNDAPIDIEEPDQEEGGSGGPPQPSNEERL